MKFNSLDFTNNYDETIKTYFLETMLELSAYYLLLIGNGYELDSIYSSCGFSGEGFILLALTKMEDGKIREFKQLMLNFRNKRGNKQ